MKKEKKLTEDGAAKKSFPFFQKRSICKLHDVPPQGQKYSNCSLPSVLAADGIKFDMFIYVTVCVCATPPPADGCQGLLCLCQCSYVTWKSEISAAETGMHLTPLFLFTHPAWWASRPQSTTSLTASNYEWERFAESHRCVIQFGLVLPWSINPECFS